MDTYTHNNYGNHNPYLPLRWACFAFDVVVFVRDSHLGYEQKRIDFHNTSHSNYEYRPVSVASFHVSIALQKWQHL